MKGNPPERFLFEIFPGDFMLLVIEQKATKDSLLNMSVCGKAVGGGFSL